MSRQPPVTTGIPSLLVLLFLCWFLVYLVW